MAGFNNNNINNINNHNKSFNKIKKNLKITKIVIAITNILLSCIFVVIFFLMGKEQILFLILAVVVICATFIFIAVLRKYEIKLSEIYKKNEKEEKK